jgi:membrane dipeptidase
MIEFPDAMRTQRSSAFDWVGFRLEEHRLTSDYAIEGYQSFADWPNLTVALARWGFNEEELRKLLGLNFLRVFREVVG